MRILMTTDAIGGVWQYSLDLASGLADREIETVLVVLGPNPSPGQIRDAQSIDGVEIINTELSLDWLACSAHEVKDSGHSVASLANRLRVALVHLNGPALAAEPR